MHHARSPSTRSPLPGPPSRRGRASQRRRPCNSPHHSRKWRNRHRPRNADAAMHHARSPSTRSPLPGPPSRRGRASQRRRRFNSPHRSRKWRNRHPRLRSVDAAMRRAGSRSNRNPRRRRRIPLVRSKRRLRRNRRQHRKRTNRGKGSATTTAARPDTRARDAT